MLVFGGKHEYDGFWSPMTYFPSYMLRRSPQKSNDDVQYSELLFYWKVPDVCFLIQFQNVHRWSFMGPIHGTTRLQRYWQFIAAFPAWSLLKGAEEKDIHLFQGNLGYVKYHNLARYMDDVFFWGMRRALRRVVQPRKCEV